MASSSAFPDLRVESLIDVKGKVILVTGGGIGLGAMMTKALALHGAKVYIASRKQEVVNEAANAINALPGVVKSGGKVVPLQADLSTKAACDALAKKVEAAEGGPGKAKLHALVNNSGISWAGTLEDFPEEKGWLQVLKINVVGMYYMTIACLPMLRRGADGNRDPARVINLGSSLGQMIQGEGYPMSGPGRVSISYDVSKAAVAHMTRSLAIDLAPQHIICNNLAPGVFPSRMTKYSLSQSETILQQETLFGRLGNEPDMAGTILWLCSKASAHIVGQTIIIDGGWNLASSGMSRL
ncbi:rhamnolipids biosynthesis 3-oxoacyl-reductase [Hyaloraphidium curvatum]|nr:rhamnolipids biosynthesis 3-oxoacyl-reductase [Hyaloraphidium curvatum]